MSKQDKKTPKKIDTNTTNIELEKEIIPNILENQNVSQFNIIEKGGNKNMYNGVGELPQTVNQNANVLFATDRVRSNRSNACCGGWLSHDTGSGLFTLVNNNRCGCATFKIDFNANITADTTEALALAIKSNGEQIAGTEMDYTPAAANIYESVSASTVIVVPAGASKTISIGNLNATATLVKNANIIITKDC